MRSGIGAQRRHKALRIQAHRAITEQRIDKRIARRLVAAVESSRGTGRTALRAIAADRRLVAREAQTDAEYQLVAEAPVRTYADAIGAETGAACGARRI